MVVPMSCVLGLGPAQPTGRRGELYRGSRDAARHSPSHAGRREVARWEPLALGFRVWCSRLEDAFLWSRTRLKWAS